MGGWREVLQQDGRECSSRMEWGGVLQQDGGGVLQQDGGVGVLQQDGGGGVLL